MLEPLTIKYKLKVISQFGLLLIMAYILLKVFIGVHNIHEDRKELQEIKKEIRDGEMNEAKSKYGWGREVD